MHTLEESERSAGRLAAVLGVARCDRETLERSPPSELVAATEEIGRRRPDPGMIPLPFLPTVDGVFLPDNPLASIATGSADGIDLMIGTNRDELTLFGLGNPSLMALDDEGMRNWVANAVPEMDSGEVVDAYRVAREPAASPSSRRTSGWQQEPISSSVGRVCSSLPPKARGGSSPRLPVRLGVACVRRDPRILPRARAPLRVRGRAVPVVQVFSGSGPEVELLSDQMQKAWLAFAASGNPSHEAIGEWQPWDPSRPSHHDFGRRTGLVRHHGTPELADPGAAPPPGIGCARAHRSPSHRALRSRMVHRGRSPTGRGRALKPSPVRVRIPPPPRSGSDRSPWCPPMVSKSQSSVRLSCAARRSRSGDRRHSISRVPCVPPPWRPSRPMVARASGPNTRALPTVHSTVPIPGAHWAVPRTARPVCHAGSSSSLRDSVTTDVALFATLPTPTIRTGLAQAMHLVRGPLFDGLRGPTGPCSTGPSRRSSRWWSGTALARGR